MLGIFSSGGRRVLETLWFENSSDGAFRHLMIGAAVPLDAETAVSPQLSFVAEALRGLHNAQQHGRPDRADRRLMEPFPDLVLLALRD